MALRGYRWYKIRESKLTPIVITSHSVNHIIEPATCGGGKVCNNRYTLDRTPPTKSCRCGYYAYNSIANALLGDHWMFYTNGEACFVEVQAWGKIQLHTKGFRAERIMLSAVYVSGPLDERIADLYLCNKRPWMEALEALTEKQAERMYGWHR